MKRLGRSVALALALSSAPAAADAQRDADRLFEEGKQLFDKGNFAAACSRFEASLALQPGIGARLWLADCYESLGRTASAQRQFRVAAEEAQKTGDKRVDVAQRRADALESRVVKIVLNVERPAPGERVVVDGIGVSNVAEPVAVDPGRHLVAASAPERTAWEATFDATSAERPFNVLVPELAPVATAPAAVPPPPPSPPPAEHPSATRIAGVATAGLGAIAIAAGGVLAYLAIKDDARSNEGCGLTCTPDAHGDRLRAIHEANAATALFIGGGVALAAGALLWFLGPRTAPASRVGLVF